ncbi:MAG: DNA polymerase III subunit alpha [Planctomycetaceae bacterium]|nr:DNA polymerase III subunit alpha [Planctomycetaceae bacterium]
MSDRPFVHLHCHSHYSLLDGASKIPALVQRAKALGMPALAITDHGNLYGAVEFLREAKAVDLKPIVGLEAYVAPGRRTDRSTGGGSGQEYAFHLTLLARDGEGVRNLMRLSSASFLEGFYYKPRIDKEILQRHSEGLICLSGCASAELSDNILHGKTAEAERLCAWYQKVFGEENFYVEIQDNGIQIQRDCAAGALDIARRMGLPVVATSDAHYLTRDDAPAHDILLCINTGKTVDDPNRMRFENDQFHVRSPEEMYAAMPGHEEALAASVRIAERVEDHYKGLNLGKRQFPSFQPPGQKTPEEYLRELCAEGLRQRYGDDPAPEVRARLDHELGIINRAGFASYFLIVWDFVRFARERGIPSSARGSACGALVSYLLYLSHVDPLRYDLLFERFLDPNRSEAPDIDIDLCKERRHEVIDYVRRKYGAANVAQIGTFGTMAAKAAIKDVGRALNIPLARVDQVTKLIPTRLNITLEDALKEEPALARMADEDPEIQKLLDFARRLEGTARNVGTHAAGVVIADRPLCDLVPLQRLPNKDKEKEVVSTQWEMGDVEKAGLLKMDFLGLRNLTSLAEAVKLVERRRGAPLDLFNLPLDDEATYTLLQRGDARGIFQLDGAGIRDLLVKMKPDCFADLIAILALYRPGPLNGGMVDEYVNVKHGRKQAVYPHPVMKEVLEETHGVMVYQEQVMRILNRLGGIELSQAYACIKAISKKKAEVIAQGRKQFIDGAIGRGLDQETATKIFDLIEFFGGYGFNKSHSTAYALVLFQTAYLKAHYPTEFMAALLSSEMDGAEREKFFVEHIDDCRKMGVEVLPPNINEGEASFKVASEGKIHFGLAAIKGVGLKAIDAIVAARAEGGPFTGLDDLFERVPLGIVSQACVEALIKAGAFDALGGKRSQWLVVLPRAAQAGQAVQEDRKRGQLGLFDALERPSDGNGKGKRNGHIGDGNGPPAAPASLPDIPELHEVERLAEEKKVLGFYMSSHPLTRHAGLLQALATHQAADLAGVSDKAEVILGGMIVNVTVRSVQKSRSGLTRMAKFTFEDLSGTVPAMLWPEEYAKNEELVKTDQIVFAKGTLDRRRDPAELIVSRIIPLARGPAELSRGVVVRLSKGQHQIDDLQKLLRQVRIRPGNLDVYLEIVGLAGIRRAIYKAGAALKVCHDDRLLSDLEGAVGPGNVRLLGQRGATARVESTPPVTSHPAADPADSPLDDADDL